MQEAVDLGRQHIKKAQEKKERDVNRKRRPVDFDVGDKVFVTTKNWRTQRPSYKLND